MPPTKRRKPTKKRRRLGRTDALLFVVSLLLRRRRPVQLSEIVEAVGCSQRTAYRLVEALHRADLIEGRGRQGYSLHRGAGRQAPVKKAAARKPGRPAKRVARR